MGQPNFAPWTAQRTMSGGFGGNITVVDKVPPELLHLVDAHWYQFPPMNPLWHGIFGFFLTILGIVSIAGNGMVIYIFSTTKSLRSPSNLLVVNLAFSDFCMMLSMAPTMVIACYYETWMLGMNFVFLVKFVIVIYCLFLRDILVRYAWYVRFSFRMYVNLDHDDDRFGSLQRYR